MNGKLTSTLVPSFSIDALHPDGLTEIPRLELTSVSWAKKPTHALCKRPLEQEADGASHVTRGPQYVRHSCPPFSCVLSDIIISLIFLDGVSPSSLSSTSGIQTLPLNVMSLLCRAHYKLTAKLAEVSRGHCLRLLTCAPVSRLCCPHLPFKVTGLTSGTCLSASWSGRVNSPVRVLSAPEWRKQDFELQMLYFHFWLAFLPLVTSL